MKPAIEVSKLSKVYNISHEDKVDRNSFKDTLSRAGRLPLELIRGRRVSKEKFWALKDVSFNVEVGDVVGIIGRNGSGKSTLLKTLSQIVEPTSGHAIMRGKVASLLEVGTGFHPELTGRENVYFNGSILGMSRREINRKFDEIVEFSEVEQFLDTPVKFYSSGMYVRLAFAIAAHLEPDILIVDEVLAVGDAAFQKKSLGKMSSVAKEGRTVLFVSHNMASVESLCNKGVFMQHGQTTGVQGINAAIREYIGVVGNTQAHRQFTEGPLRSVEAVQTKDGITIAAEYQTTKPVDLPALGFVIKNDIGQPIMGANPRVFPPTKPPKPSASGRVECSIALPRLLNGTYTVSVWFGDSATDFAAEEDCLAFEVQGWATNKHQPAEFVGAVEPVCEWKFI